MLLNATSFHDSDFGLELFTHCTIYFNLNQRHGAVCK
jgi:hypothetical protein